MKSLNENKCADVCFNITELKQYYTDVDFNDIRDTLVSLGAIVDGDRKDDGTVIMCIDELPMNRIIQTFNSFGIIDAEDYIYDNCNSDIDGNYPSWEDADAIGDQQTANADYPSWNEADEYDKDDFINDDEYLSESRRLKRNARHINEKRKGCCPPKKKMVKLSEALKAYQDKDQNDLDKIEKNFNGIRSSLDGLDISTYEAKSALAKIKAEMKKLSKIKKTEDENFSLKDIKGIKKMLATIKKSDPESEADVEKLLDRMDNALKEGNKTLNSCKINGKPMNSCSTKTLKESAIKLNSMLKKVNKDSEQYETIEKCLNRIYEEVTYRSIYGMLNEDGESTLSDEDLAKMFGAPIEGDDTEDALKKGEDTEDAEDTSKKSEDAEGENTEDTEGENTEDTEDTNDEEVYLSRIEITLVGQEAAENLKSLCVDGGIPEDVLEVVPVEEKDEEPTEEDETEKEGESEKEGETEETETGEESEADEEKEDAKGDANESRKYSALYSLLNEGEAPEDDKEEGEGEGDKEESDDKESEEGDDTEKTEGQYKVVLTDTDYAIQLQQILDDNYGITEDEFNEYIGGEMQVEDSDDEKDSEKEDDKEESDDKEKEDDLENVADDINPEDLFKGL